MKVVVAGSRDIGQTKIVFRAIRSTGLEITEMASGSARGVDSIAENFARVYHVPFTQFPAYYDQYGNSKGEERNKKIVEWADALVAVWDGESQGTRDLIRAMNLAEKPVFLFLVNTPD